MQEKSSSPLAMNAPIAHDNKCEKEAEPVDILAFNITIIVGDDIFGQPRLS